MASSARRASSRLPFETSHRGDRGIVSMPRSRMRPGTSWARMETRHPVRMPCTAQFSQNAALMPIVMASWYRATSAPRRWGAATSDW